MERRKFIRNSFLTGAASITVGQSFAGNKNGISLTENKPFNLDYAIHDGMFKNHAGEIFWTRYSLLMIMDFALLKIMA